MSAPRGPRQGRPAETPPSVSAAPTVRTAADQLTDVRLTLTNNAPEPRVMSVTALGVDAAWLPRPFRTRPVLPGESVAVDMPLQPTVGTIPAQYPVAFAVQALDPVTDQAMSATSIANVNLVVDAPGMIEIEIDPEHITARSATDINVRLTNVGRTPESVNLEVHAPYGGMHVELDTNTVEVLPGESEDVEGRITLARQWFGHPYRYTYTISARGSGAARRAEAAVTAKAYLGASSSRWWAITGIVVLWAATAIVLIPRLGTSVQNGANKAGNQLGSLQGQASGKINSKVPKKTTTASAGASGSSGGSATSGGTGASGSSSSPGGSGSSKSSGSSGSGKARSAAAANTVQLNGTVGGSAPSGVSVAIAPTSLVNEAAQSATPVGVQTAAFTEIGKIPENALFLNTPTSAAPSSTTSQSRGTVTSGDGAWSFPGVRKPGYFMLTFAKAGYQTQRYVVDTTSAAATQPMQVTLAPGEGHLSGMIRGPGGAVGGAKITISDGTNTITTSSDSKGTVGKWSIDGLSTPDSYLVAASQAGLSTESAQVTLAAGGTSTIDLALKAGATSLIGTVRGPDSLGDIVGVGGAQITASDGNKITRTATTITNGSVAGSYILPDLPPGAYTVTVSADGYLSQTQEVTIKKGQSQAQVDAMLSQSSGRVIGTVLDAAGAGIVGAGITLTSGDNGYKIITGDGGSFLVNGVTPGTYVVSADAFNKQTGFKTVTVTAGQLTTVPTFRLVDAVTTSTSTITGFVGDTSNPSGTVCAGSADKCTLTFVLKDSSGTNVPITPASVQGVATSGPTGYTLHGADSSGNPIGLQPGLYQLTIGVQIASGTNLTSYLPATVSVQVPFNGVGHAPQVNLTTGASISGVISSTFDPTDNNTITNCVWAVPDASTFVPSNCTAPDPATSDCLTAGKPDVAMAVIAGPKTDASDPRIPGSYAMTGLCAANTTTGTAYKMYIIVTNPDFVPATANPSQPLLVHVSNSSQFNGQIQRLGHLIITFTTPDPTTGTPHLLTGVTLNSGSQCVSTGATVDLSGKTVGSDGTLLVTKLPAGAYTCTVSTTVSGNTLTDSVGPVNVVLDGTANATVTLTLKLNAFAGRIVTTFGGAVLPLSGTVTIFGVTGYTNGVANPPQKTDDLTVSSGTNGCFAVTADGTAPSSLPGACAGQVLLPNAIGKLSLAIPTAEVRVSAPGYQPFDQNVPISGGSLNQINLIPNPVDFSGTLTGAPSGTNLPGTTIAVAGFPVGTGDIVAKSDASGNISWADSKAGAGQKIIPGDYTIVVRTPGLTPWTYSFECAPGVACVQSFPLHQLGSVTIAGVPNNAAVTLVRNDGTDIGPQTAPSGSTTFNNLEPTEILITPTPSTVPAGMPISYTVQVQAPGFQFNSSVPVSCISATGAPLGSGVVVTEGTTNTCTVQSDALTPEGTIKGTVRGLSSFGGTATSTPLSGATVKADPCTGQATGNTCPTATPGKFQAMTDSSAADCPSPLTPPCGGYTLTGTADVQGLDPGTYQLTVSQPGYLDGTAVVTVVLGVNNAPEIDLHIMKLPTFTVTVDDATGQVLTSSATVNLIQGTTTVYTQPTSAGVASFTDLFPGSYTVQVVGAAFPSQTASNVTVDATHTTFTIGVTLGASALSGTVSGAQGASMTPTALDGVTVKVGTGADVASFAQKNGTDGNPMQATTSSGSYRLNNVPNSPSGGWTIEFSKDGYVTQVITSVSVDFHNASSPVDETLPRETHPVTVTLTDTNGFLPNTAAPMAHLVALATNPPQGSMQMTLAAGKWTATFPNVPSDAGADSTHPDWAVYVDNLPANHFGVVKNGSSLANDSTHYASFAVTPDGSSAAVNGPALTLDEGQINLSIATAPVPLDPHSSTAPGTLTLTVGGVPGFDGGNFTVGGTSPTPIWVTPGPYTLSVSAPPSGWTADNPTVTANDSGTATAGTVTLTEQGKDVTVHVANGAGTALGGATVTIASAPGSVSMPSCTTASAPPASLGECTFSDVPFGDYTFDVSAGSLAATAQPFSVTSTSTNPQTVDVTVS